jgi:membrane protein DedA with SNARE-associated domain
MSAVGALYGMYAGIFDSIGDAFDWLFDSLDDWSANTWFLAVIFAIAFLDSVIPVVPSETCVIIGGVAVSTGTADYPLWAVILAGAAGAFLGDNAAYFIGRLFAPRLERRAARKEKFRARLLWAYEQIQEKGGPLLITVRFIPGGRSILTLSCGITRQPRKWFVKWVAIAAVIWATYAAGLAYIVGQPFKDDHTTAFLVAFFTALGITASIEVIRYLRKRRQRSAAMATESPSA